MDLQEKVKLHREISNKIEELEDQKKALGIAIMEQMPGKTMKLPGFLVRRFDRLSISLSLEQARALSAVKLEETVDKEKIKTLYKNGQSITGVRQIQYIQITTPDCAPAN